MSGFLWLPLMWSNAVVASAALSMVLEGWHPWDGLLGALVRIGAPTLVFSLIAIPLLDLRSRSARPQARAALFMLLVPAGTFAATTLVVIVEQKLHFMEWHHSAWTRQGAHQTFFTALGTGVMQLLATLRHLVLLGLPAAIVLSIVFARRPGQVRAVADHLEATP